MLASSKLNMRRAAHDAPVALPAPATRSTPAVSLWMYRLLGVRPAAPLPAIPADSLHPALKAAGITPGSTLRCTPR